ncbi:hypothetical protein ACIQNI_08730 [Streptomyces sp. NPDC091266]
MPKQEDQTKQTEPTELTDFDELVCKAEELAARIAAHLAALHGKGTK